MQHQENNTPPWPVLVGMQQPGEATGVSPLNLPQRRVGRDLSQESKGGFYVTSVLDSLTNLLCWSVWAHHLTSPLSSRNKNSTPFSVM